MDIRDYNRRAWDAESAKGNPWTVPVDAETIARARSGDWQIVLTPQKPVPQDWFPALPGLEVLCLASGGGQQAPILAAAGAQVTSYDNSPRQLQADAMVAEREGLDLRTIAGDMRDLAALADASFDLVVHAVSNCFVPDVLPVWREAFRVLRPGGELLAGFGLPATYIFDDLAMEEDRLEVRYSIPYSDLTSLSEERRQYYIDRNEPMQFGHSLQDQIGGQLAAGFVLVDCFEDRREGVALDRHLATFMATRARKPG